MPGRRAVVSARSQPWDLLVVGGGTAGLVGAQTAAGLGARVLLVERDRTGGECLWTGCVPSKALLAAAGSAAQARRAPSLGIDVGEVRVDFAAVMDHVRGAVEQIAPDDSPETPEAAGVTVARGTVRFTGPGTADVDGLEVGFRQALLATGAAPSPPPVPGLGEVEPLTSDTIWDLTNLPERLVVLGGGSTGCELGQALARLGSAVTIVERAPEILGGEDPAAAGLVRRSLKRDGVVIRTGRTAVSARRAATGVEGGGRLLLDDDTELGFDRLLVATGRSPQTQGLGLEQVGVDVDDDGSPVVDRSLRTSNPRIWAAGDVTKRCGFTHVAGVHASLAATNALLGLRRQVGHTVPRVTFTQPEVAAVGAPTHDLGPGHRLLTWPHSQLDRAVTDGDTAGTSMLVIDRRGRIVGATVVGPRAGETIGELVLAIDRRTTALRLAAITHPYPTYDDGPWNAAIAELRRGAATPAAQRAVGVVVGLRRRWLDRR